MSADAPTATAPSPAPLPLDGAEPTRTHAWKDGSFGFRDVLDALNPLQHIPVISSIYRWATGDEPGNVARIAGDTLFTGPFGAAASLFNIAFREETGKDPGEMLLSLVTGSDPGNDTPTAMPAIAVAANATPTPAPDGAAPTATSTAAPSMASEPALAKAAAAAVAAPPSAAPAASAVPSPPAPFISLYKSSPAAAAAPGVTHGDTAEQAFLAQRAQMQRGLSRAGAGRPVNNVIPLQLTGGAHFMATNRAPVTSPAANPSAPAAADAPAAAPSSAIAQRMLDALDKYSQMKQQQRGGQLDLSP